MEEKMDSVKNGLTRRRFLRDATLATVGLVVVSCSPAPSEEADAPVEAATNAPVEEAATRDKIVIGAARPLSGPLAFFEETSFGPIYKMWVDEVNEKGGIYVEEYGKQLPIEMLVYDDKSDLGTSTRLLEKLILEDKVDFVLSPASTAFVFAAGAVANRHEYIFMSAEGGATTIKDMIPGMPYFFQVIQFSDHYQMPALAEILEEQGAESVAIVYIEDLHGIEYSGIATKELNNRGIDVAMIKSVPPDIKDMTPILREAEALGVDAYLSFTYPDTNFLTTTQMRELGINFPAILFGPGANSEVYKDTFGADVVEGVMGEGAWNPKSTPGTQEFYDKFVERYGPGLVDWWGPILMYAALQHFEQAIEKAGTLDQKTIRDIMATETFDTVLGPTWYDNQLLSKDVHPGEIGQWQNGGFEVIDVGDKRTAPPIYPKPDWPAP